MHPTPDVSRRAAYTALGVLPILFWSTTVAFSRQVAEALGPFTGPAVIYLVSGALGVIVLLARQAELRAMLRLPVRYLLGCGALFVAYMVVFYWAIGHAATGQQTVEVGLVNYLWPSLTIVFSVPVLGRRARPMLAPGILIALAGVFLAIVDPTRFSWAGLAANLASNPAPYVCALCGAVIWALYSNLSRLWAGGHEGGAVPLFLAVSGLTLLAVRLVVSEPPPNWSGRAIAETAYMGVFVGLLSYVLWDRAVRRGHIIVLASLSYFIPLMSTLLSCAMLGVPMRSTLWVSCGLLIAGAWLCSRSVTEQGR